MSKFLSETAPTIKLALKWSMLAYVRVHKHFKNIIVCRSVAWIRVRGGGKVFGTLTRNFLPQAGPEKSKVHCLKILSETFPLLVLGYRVAPAGLQLNVPGLSHLKKAN